ncbi:MAG TPA: cupin domain-containing protein [Ilumatobacteraceae bacterium]
MPELYRREFHPEAPRLHDFVGDRATYLADDIYRRVRDRPSVSAVLTAIEDGALWADPDRLWNIALTGGLRAPSFRMVRDGSTLSRADTCRPAGVGHAELDDLIEPNRVLELHDAGASLVLQGLQHTDAAFAQLSTNLALDLDQPVQVNAYISPADARALDMHFDFHDVIVVQLAGRKRWRVWAPLERTSRPVKSGASIAPPRIDELGAPLVDRSLVAGDCLAVPRGFPHATETVDDASTHLTIGIMALTWERVIRRFLTAGVSGTALADRLAAGALEEGYDAGVALSAMSDVLDADALRGAVASEVWRRQPRTRLRPRCARVPSPEQSLRVTPGPLLRLARSNGRSRLELGDRCIVVPAEAHELIAAVLTTARPFVVDDVLGDLEVASAMVVLQRLVAEGVLAFA